MNKHFKVKKNPRQIRNRTNFVDFVEQSFQFRQNYSLIPFRTIVSSHRDRMNNFVIEQPMERSRTK